MDINEYRQQLLDCGVSLRPTWAIGAKEQPFTLQGFRAHDEQGKYLGLVIVQQILSPEGEPDGLTTFVETLGNKVQTDAIAILTGGLRR